MARKPPQPPLWRIVDAKGDTVGWVPANDAEEAAKKFLETSPYHDNGQPLTAVPTRGTH